MSLAFDRLRMFPKWVTWLGFGCCGGIKKHIKIIWVFL